MQVHVEGMERVVMLGHEKKDLPLASTSWTVAADVKGKNSLMSNGTLLSCPSSTIQEDVSAIVMQVIDNLLETVIRHGNQCNDEALEEQMVKAGSQTLLADVNEAVAAATTVMEGQEHCCSAIKTTMIGEREKHQQQFVCIRTRLVKFQSSQLLQNMLLKSAMRMW